ncbi:MAG: GNAT family N-acetyltransferase [Edaphocola sp.]
MTNKQQYCDNATLLRQLPVFYQPWYLDIFGLRWDVWLHEDDYHWLVFPFFKEKKAGISISRPPAYTPYYGPYFLPKNDQCPNKQLLDRELISSIPKMGMVYLQPHYSMDCGVLQQERFRHIDRVTHVLDLNQEEDVLWQNLHYMRRKNINKAAKELVLYPNTFDTDLYYDWIKATYEARGDKLRQPRQLIKRYVTQVCKYNAAISNTYADPKGMPVAVSLCLYDRLAAYSILGANNPAVKHSAATTALLWQAITAAKKTGCGIFDFEGSSIPNIADFFGKFGSRRIEYKAWQQVNSLVWKMREKLA